MLKHNLSILGSKYIYLALILNSNKDSLFIYEDPFEERVYCNKPNGDFFCGHSFVCLFVPFEVGILLKISAPQKSLSTGSWKRGGRGRQGAGLLRLCHLAGQINTIAERGVSISIRAGKSSANMETERGRGACHN